MVSFFLIALLTWLSSIVIKRTLLLRKHIGEAKKSGLPYIVAPVTINAGYLWTAVGPLLLPLIAKIYPAARHSLWWKAIDVHHSWHFQREIYDEIGDTWMAASPGQNYIATTSVELMSQIVSRRTEFAKPIEMYTIVDMYGSSMLSSEGAQYRRHKKIIAPAFNEKSNNLVWEESIRQAEGLVELWGRHTGNTGDEMKVEDTAEDILQMALHVISGAGFGVPQLWPGQDRSKLEGRTVEGFNTEKLGSEHQLTFIESLDRMVNSVIWLALLPVPVLKLSPFEIHKKVLSGFFEMGDYFRELAEYKLNQIEKGQIDEGTMDLMGPMLRATENDHASGDYMTKQEVTANSWIFLFAGHETSANILHFSLLFLAINRPSQARLQADIEKIARGRKSSEWTYATDMGRFYNSMVGAVQNETLRLMPPIIDIPKQVCDKDQTLTLDGKELLIPANTFVHLDAVNTHRNPKYYPHKPSKISGLPNDLYDFVPERWLLNRDDRANPTDMKDDESGTKETDGLETASFESKGAGSLYSPPRCAFLGFSEGARSCPGRRFAQVEITAVIAAIFANYTVELDVKRWASDEEVDKMSDTEKREVYAKAMKRARTLIRESKSVITLKMYGDKVPVRVVRKGKERFACCAVEE